MTKPVESAPKLNLLKSLTMLEDAQRLTPGGVGGIAARRMLKPNGPPCVGRLLGAAAIG